MIVAMGLLRVIVAAKWGGRTRSVFSASGGRPGLDFASARCPSCGTSLGADGNSCRNCGWYLDQKSLPRHPSGRKMGVVQRDIAVDGRLAFRKGELVLVEGEAADTANPENKYIVQSDVIGKKYLLSSQDVYI